MLFDDLIIILLALFASIILLLVFRSFGLLKKGNCPNCNAPLKRKHRTLNDKVLIAITLYILPFKRYKCRRCGWEGLRWEIEKKAPRP